MYIDLLLIYALACLPVLFCFKYLLFQFNCSNSYKLPFLIRRSYHSIGVLLYNLNSGNGIVTQIGTTYSMTNVMCASSDSSFTKLTFGVQNGKFIVT